MKSIKLGLVVLAALMAMAFLGVSPAMAESTAFCKEDVVAAEGEACPEGKRISHVHEETLSTASAKLLTNVGTAECHVLFLGDVQNANDLGNPLEISGHFTYTECKRESTSCTVAEITGTNSKIKVLKLGHELSDVTYQFEVNWHCGIFINCTYNGTNLLGHGLGPLLATEANAEVRLEEQTTNRIAGSLCPSTAKLDLLTTSSEVEDKNECGEVIEKLKTYIAE